MKLISWNVNGLRAVITKGDQETYKNLDADIMCLQETKMQKEQIKNDIEELFKDRNEYWNSEEKKGYSGTVVISKIKTINITYGIGKEKHDKEGRIITVEFNEFYLVNCYT